MTVPTIEELAYVLKKYQHTEDYEIPKPNQDAVLELSSLLNRLLAAKEEELKVLKSIGYIAEENFKNFGTPDVVNSLISSTSSELEALEAVNSIVRGIE